MSSIDREYKGYLLRGAMQGKVWGWKVYNKQKAGVAEGKASSREEADIALTQAVEQIIETEFASRKNGIPTAEEYQQALGAILKPGHSLWEMLKAHYEAPGKRCHLPNWPMQLDIKILPLPTRNTESLVASYVST